MRHTPGPWGVGGSDDSVWITPPNPEDNVICDIVGRHDPIKRKSVIREEDEANAKLIAAAPELLAACMAAEEAFDSGPLKISREYATVLSQIREAIVKATEDGR